MTRQHDGRAVPQPILDLLRAPSPGAARGLRPEDRDNLLECDSGVSLDGHLPDAFVAELAAVSRFANWWLEDAEGNEARFDDYPVLADLLEALSAPGSRRTLNVLDPGDEGVAVIAEACVRHRVAFRSFVRANPGSDGIDMDEIMVFEPDLGSVAPTVLPARDGWIDARYVVREAEADAARLAAASTLAADRSAIPQVGARCDEEAMTALRALPKPTRF